MSGANVVRSSVGYKQVLGAASREGNRLCGPSKLFRLRYIKEHTVTLFHQEHILQSTGIERSLRLVPKTQQRPQRGLWWSATVAKAVSIKATVRNRTRRRLKQAFVESLADHGYDGNGAYAGTVMNRPIETMDLRGSLMINGLRPAMSAPWSELRQATNALVQNLQRESRILKK